MGLQIKPKTGQVSLSKMADIMFCIDNSGSMSPCIDGVRATVSSFVSSLEAGVEGQSPVDCQIGLLNYSDCEFIFVDLAKDTTKFKARLGEDINGWDEYTPGAIDYAISNANWRMGAQRVIVVFTDETISGGAGGESQFDSLLKKIVDSHIQIVYYGPDCPYYAKFSQCPKAEVNVVSDFSGVNFNALMSRLAVTVSSNSLNASKLPVSKTLVYDLSSVNIK